MKQLNTDGLLDSSRQSLNTLFFLLVIGILGGCAGNQARLQAGGSFAAAGVAYVDALPAVFDESFELQVAANSTQLLLSREDLDEDERSDRLEQAAEGLQKRKDLLLNLRQHSLLLRSYFIALRAITSSDNASGINMAAQGVVTRLTDLGSKIRENPDNQILSKLVESGIKLTVGTYQNRALQSELEARGVSIARELSLQKAVIDILVEEMTDNATIIIQIEELNPIYDEYVSAGEVPADWNDKRLSAYNRTISLRSYDDIRRAAANMQSSWMALVENRAGADSISLLIADIESLLATARLFKAN